MLRQSQTRKIEKKRKRKEEEKYNFQALVRTRSKTGR